MFWLVFQVLFSETLAISSSHIWSHRAQNDEAMFQILQVPQFVQEQSGIEENLLQHRDSTQVYFNKACIDATGPQRVKAARIFINRPQWVWHSAAATRINLSSLHSGSYRAPHGSVCSCGLQKLPRVWKIVFCRANSCLPLSFAWPHIAAGTRQAHLISSKALGRINSFAVLHFQYIVKTLLTEAYVFKRADIFMSLCLPALLFSLRACVCLWKRSKGKKRKKKMAS